MGTRNRNANRRGDEFTVGQNFAGSHEVVNTGTGKRQVWHEDGVAVETTADRNRAQAVADALTEFNQK